MVTTENVNKYLYDQLCIDFIQAWIVDHDRKTKVVGGTVMKLLKHSSISGSKIACLAEINV